MHPGVLVTTKNRWSLNSKNIGLVIKKNVSEEDTWLVMWTTKGSYEFREHIADALIVIESE